STCLSDSTVSVASSQDFLARQVGGGVIDLQAQLHFLQSQLHLFTQEPHRVLSYFVYMARLSDSEELKRRLARMKRLIAALEKAPSERDQRRSVRRLCQGFITVRVHRAPTVTSRSLSRSLVATTIRSSLEFSRSLLPQYGEASERFRPSVNASPKKR